MRYKFSYKDQIERDLLIAEHADKYLVEEQNIIDGNFLIFSDELEQEKIIYTQVPEQEFTDLKQKIELQDSAMQELMFMILPEINGGGI